MNVVVDPSARETFTPRELTDAYQQFKERGPQYVNAETGLRAAAYRFGTRVLLVYQESEMDVMVLIHPTSWKGNSRKSAYSIVRRTPPQNRRARSLAHPHSMTDPYMLWCWIDIRNRECSPAAVELDRTTHVSCVALHSPVSGVATPRHRPSRRR
jgi:hypothetical protein